MSRKQPKRTSATNTAFSEMMDKTKPPAMWMMGESGWERMPLDTLSLAMELGAMDAHEPDAVPISATVKVSLSLNDDVAAELTDEIMAKAAGQRLAG